jgi:DnaJ-class molecular chaperone
VTKTASDDEIKKAYGKRALAHHPGSFLNLLLSFEKIHEFLK